MFSTDEVWHNLQFKTSKILQGSANFIESKTIHVLKSIYERLRTNTANMH